jgi:hypothetical protein
MLSGTHVNPKKWPERRGDGPAAHVGDASSRILKSRRLYLNWTFGAFRLALAKLAADESEPKEPGTIRR